MQDWLHGACSEELYPARPFKRFILPSTLSTHLRRTSKSPAVVQAELRSVATAANVFTVLSNIKLNLMALTGCVNKEAP